MTENPMDRPITGTLSLGQTITIRDLIGEAVDHTSRLSPPASHHADAWRGADATLETAIRDDIHDR